MNRPLYRGNGFAADRSRGWDGDRDHRRRRDYWNGYGYGYGYPYYYPGPIFTGYVDPWLFGPDDYDNGYGAGSGYAPDPNYGGGYAGYGNDVPAPYQNYGQQPDDSGNPYPQEYRQRPYDEQAPPQQPSSGRPAYNGGALSGSATLLPQQEVTVIFKDGRPAEQIDNYMLTSTTLTVLDVQRRQIPIDEINVDATVAANRAAGVDFRVPGGLR